MCIRDRAGATGAQGEQGEFLVVELNGDTIGLQGPAGPAGPAGATGATGVSGLNCWDLNGNGNGDPNEDINEDGNFDALDCQHCDVGDGSSLFLGAVKDLKQEKDEEIKDLEGVIENQQSQIDDLKTLLEQLLTNQQQDGATGSQYVLSLQEDAYLAQNKPNPFIGHTLIDYFIPANAQSAHVQVARVDGKILGKVVIQETGNGQVIIKTNNYPAGTYFYSLVLDGIVLETKQMVVK